MTSNNNTICGLQPSICAGDYVGEAIYFPKEILLSGTLPTELARLNSTLKTIFLSQNALSGTIPSEWSALSRLVGLWLENNPLSGTLAVLGDLNSLEHASAGGRISGTLPRSLSAALESVSLGQLNSHLPLSGTLPPEWGALSRLVDLSIRPCNLSGTIPSELGGLSALDSLLITGQTSLSGTLPSELGSLQKLGFLYLNGSVGLSGTIALTLALTLTLTSHPRTPLTFIPHCRLLRHASSPAGLHAWSRPFGDRRAQRRAPWTLQAERHSSPPMGELLGARRSQALMAQTHSTNEHPVGGPIPLMSAAHAKPSD